jgi:MraZ protein
MLIGQYDGKIDSKGRTALPKKFREILGEKLIVTLGYENALIVVSEKNWKALLEGTEGRPFIDYATRETQRFLLGGASGIELDDKGRFILPAYLRDYAKVKNDVVFIGLSRYVEIWDKTVWEEYRKTLAKNIDTISQRLVDKETKGNE